MHYIPCAGFRSNFAHGVTALARNLRPIRCSPLPFAAFVQRLAILSSFTDIHLDVQHIPGDKNVEADYLSRWKPPATLASRWQPAFRRQFTLRQLWGAAPPAVHFSEIVETSFSASGLLHSWGGTVELPVFSSESRVSFGGIDTRLTSIHCQISTWGRNMPIHYSDRPSRSTVAFDGSHSRQ